MKCWNCHKEIPDNAKACVHCEASLEEKPSLEEMKAVGGILADMPPDVLQDLHKAVSESSTAEEFVNRIFVGDCPKCNSENTGCCEHDPEIDNICVGRCFDCGQLFCTECLKLLEAGKTDCSCLDDDSEMDFLDEMDEFDEETEDES